MIAQTVPSLCQCMVHTWLPEMPSLVRVAPSHLLPGLSSSSITAQLQEEKNFLPTARKSRLSASPDIVVSKF